MGRIASICLLLTATGGLSGTATGRPVETAAIQIVPTPPPAATEERMRLWHLDYRIRILPVLQGWQDLARATRERPGSRLTAGCRRLDLALTGLAQVRLPLAPDPSVSLHLEETLRSLADAARSCTQGAYFLTTWRLQEADDSWRQLRGRLLMYGLAP